MLEKPNNSVMRAILHALPTAVLALDSTDTILLANAAASRLLATPRDHLEGGSLARFVSPGSTISSSAHVITFAAASGPVDVVSVAKELIVDDVVIRVVLLKPAGEKHEQALLGHISGLAQTNVEPFRYVCETLVALGITQHACVRETTSTECIVRATTSNEQDIFSQFPTVARTILKNEVSHIELVIIPDAHNGLRSDDLSIIDMFIALLHLRVDTSESASDAVGSETALALALKAGDMGMCFFDTTRGDCYLSDQLATWCGINIDTFSGTISAWLDTFQEDDRIRFSALLSELAQHKKFKTVVHIHTLEQDIRLELFGRPLHDKTTSEWVTIVRPYRDEQEVEAAWQTRIAMEESARVQAEDDLTLFEKTLIETLLPTTSDVSIIHSRQDAGTWHIVRQLDSHTCVYAVGAVTAGSRAQAVIGATLIATIADVLASQTHDINEFVELVRDHARARDIETSIAAVRVVNGDMASATHAGASVYISGKSFVGEETITATTALSLSTHSQATPETIDVASDGRPWRIMTTVVEVISLIDTSPQTTFDNEHESPESDEGEDIGVITGVSQKFPHGANVSPFRSGSIGPS